MLIQTVVRRQETNEQTFYGNTVGWGSALLAPEYSGYKANIVINYVLNIMSELRRGCLGSTSR